jgi:hypothetical protein
VGIAFGFFLPRDIREILFRFLYNQDIHTENNVPERGIRNQCRLVKNLNADDADASNADFRGFLASETVLIRVRQLADPFDPRSILYLLTKRH